MQLQILTYSVGAQIYKYWKNQLLTKIILPNKASKIML